MHGSHFGVNRGRSPHWSIIAYHSLRWLGYFTVSLVIFQSRWSLIISYDPEQSPMVRVRWSKLQSRLFPSDHFTIPVGPRDDHCDNTVGTAGYATARYVHCTCIGEYCCCCKHYRWLSARRISLRTFTWRWILHLVKLRHVFIPVLWSKKWRS